MYLNSSKIKYIALNAPSDVTLTTADLEKVYDFKYLRSYIMGTTQDIKVRKAKAWKGVHNMSTIWTSYVYS